ncbi:MAG: DUF1844 domain-containing protein [Candidatus Neomarinimicrobiota bacterium]|jgi:hypothetical protein|nr:DUF1844 domain-containing protein [Candidatus Neomarinimicrobiota bacterium]|tara:strand:+ start:1353 stop:1754 length:402 start_codon:yes stop_codon:yes gene_type:complete
MSLESKLTEQQLFDQLISSLVHSAWVYLGKVKNPMNDKLEKNIDQASVQIDMLDMLFKRMTGNLSEEEEQYLSHIIRELKMNFVEEKNNPEKSNDSQSVEKESKDESDLESETNNTNGKAEDKIMDKTEVKKD